MASVVRSKFSGAELGSASLKDRVAFVTGASRGIGKAIALMLARNGAKVAVAAKTAEPHPKLAGTIYETAKEIEALSGPGSSLAVITDVRDNDAIEAAVKQTVDKFGHLDILVNNASAIWMKGTLDTPVKRFDLMNQINSRGTYACTRACLPHLLESAKNGRNPHVLNLSPPLDMHSDWFGGHVAYTMAKYGMSMCVLGHSAEFKHDKIAVNALWPRTGIATAAVEFELGGKEALEDCRTVDIMADAAECIFTREFSDSVTGKFFIDDEVLLGCGLTQEQVDGYNCVKGKASGDLMPDFFLRSMIPVKAKL